MATPLGLETQTTTGNVLTKTDRFREVEWLNRIYQPFVITCIPDDCLYPLKDYPATSKDEDKENREKRLLQIATTGLEELPVSIWEKPLPLILGFPDDPAAKQLDHHRFLEHLNRQTHLSLDVKRSQVYSQGRAAGIIAVKEAIKLIETGSAEMILAGGCDTYKNLTLLRDLDLLDRIKSDIAEDFFIPGEGAGFLVLCREETAISYDMKILGYIHTVAIANESVHFHSDRPCLGEGLTACFAQLFEELKTAESIEKILSIYSGMNGESYWTREWSSTLIRMQEWFEPRAKVCCTADFLGDTGAASGPIMAGIALTASNMIKKREPTIVFSASDGKQRAVMLLS